MTPIDLIASLPLIGSPPKVSPVRLALVSPQAMPVSLILKCSTRSRSPSPSTSLTWPCECAMPAPSGPKATVDGSTSRASKDALVRIATGILPPDRGLTPLGSLPGLMSISTWRVTER